MRLYNILRKPDNEQTVWTDDQILLKHYIVWGNLVFILLKALKMFWVETFLSI